MLGKCSNTEFYPQLAFGVAVPPPITVLTSLEAGDIGHTETMNPGCQDIVKLNVCEC